MTDGKPKAIIARRDVGPFVLKGSAGQAIQPFLVDITFGEIDAREALVPGDYTAELALVKLPNAMGDGTTQGGKNVTLSSVIQNITRLDDTAPLPKVFIDRQKRTIVDGKPFFPMGFYFSTSLVHAGSSALGNLSGTPFNYIVSNFCPHPSSIASSQQHTQHHLFAASPRFRGASDTVLKFLQMPYGEATLAEMDAAAAAGLKVGFSLKDIFFGSHWCPNVVTSRAVEEQYFKSRVAAFRNHSALLAWYINDELTPAYLPQLKAHQQWLIEGDTDHPSWQVLCENGEFDDYMGTFDILGSDPYPIGSGNKTTSGVHSEVNTTVFQTDNARPIWEVIQAMNWANYHKGVPCPRCHTPTFRETRSMVW